MGLYPMQCRRNLLDDFRSFQQAGMMQYQPGPIDNICLIQGARLPEATAGVCQVQTSKTNTDGNSLGPQGCDKNIPLQTPATLRTVTEPDLVEIGLRLHFRMTGRHHAERIIRFQLLSQQINNVRPYFASFIESGDL